MAEIWDLIAGLVASDVPALDDNQPSGSASAHPLPPDVGGEPASDAEDEDGTPVRRFHAPFDASDASIETEAAWHAVSVLAPLLRDKFRDRGDRPIVVHYGGDCSGGDAPAVAWASLARVLNHLNIVNVELEHEFASEHPAPLHTHSFLLQNTKCKVLYNDMHRRTSKGGPAVHVEGRQAADDHEELRPA